MFTPKLGVSLATLSNPLTFEAIQAVGESQIATLEVAADLLRGEGSVALKAALREMLGRTAVRVTSVHASFGGEFDISLLDHAAHEAAVVATEAAIVLAAELGASYVVIHAGGEPIGPAERAERVDQAVAGLRRLAGQAAEADLRIAVEVLPRTCLGNTVAEMLAMLDAVGAENVGACMDTNHLMDRYAELPDWIRRLGERLIATHLSDYGGIDERHKLPGIGVIDWPAVVGALREIGYPGPFNYECKPSGQTPAEKIRCLEENFAWLAGL